MNGETICKRIQEIIDQINKDEGEARDIEAIRDILNDWDPYACC